MISLNKTAHDLIDNNDMVELLYDRDRQVMALRAADESAPHAYAVRTGSKRGPGQAMIAATAFTAHYDIDTTATRRWKPFVEDGMLCRDLSEKGTVITGNRTKSTALIDSVAKDHSSVDDVVVDSLAEDPSDPASVTLTPSLPDVGNERNSPYGSES